MASADSSTAKSSARRKVGVCLFLVAITWLVFGQTIRYDFVNYDDNEYVYANPTITRGLTLHGRDFCDTPAACRIGRLDFRAQRCSKRRFLRAHSRRLRPLCQISVD